MSDDMGDYHTKRINDWDKKARKIGCRRIHIPDWLQRYKLFDQGSVCAACRKTARDWHNDHKRRLGDGGNNTYGNLQVLCPDCHAAKTSAEVASLFADVDSDQHGYGKARKNLHRELSLKFEHLIDSRVHEPEENKRIKDGLQILAQVLVFHGMMKPGKLVEVTCRGEKVKHCDYSLVLEQFFSLSEIFRLKSSHKSQCKALFALCQFLERLAENLISTEGLAAIRSIKHVIETRSIPIVFSAQARDDGA